MGQQSTETPTHVFEKRRADTAAPELAAAAEEEAEEPFMLEARLAAAAA